TLSPRPSLPVATLSVNLPSNVMGVIIANDESHATPYIRQLKKAISQPIKTENISSDHERWSTLKFIFRRDCDEIIRHPKHASIMRRQVIYRYIAPLIGGWSQGL